MPIYLSIFISVNSESFFTQLIIWIWIFVGFICFFFLRTQFCSQVWLIYSKQIMRTTCILSNHFFSHICLGHAPCPWVKYLCQYMEHCNSKSRAQPHSCAHLSLLKKASKKKSPFFLYRLFD